MSHAIERTSPTGPGQKFVGRCIKCGQSDLLLADGLKDCPSDKFMSDEEAMLRLLDEQEE